MTTEKFTSGDWRTNQRPHGKISIIGDNGQQVCLMRNSKERDDNANLIKASKDMYRALCDVIAESRHIGYVRTETIDRCDAVLTKAEGVGL